MSNGSKALPLALGAGSGLLLWYLLRDGKQPARAAALPTTAPANRNRALPAPAVAAPTQAGPGAPATCALRLDEHGLTADGVRVSIPEAIHRCQRAGRAALTVSNAASATAYADLMIALGDAGIPACAHRNGAGRGRDDPRTVDDVHLESFADMVLAVAGEVEPDPNQDGRARGRFGDRKVFIAAIRRMLRGTYYRSLPRAAVDELLVRAHREGLLTLARADLVAAMDPEEVDDSEITHGGIATFHFVVSERDAEPRPSAADKE